jgi:Lrp/AsnC family transcriptional regulator
MDTIDRKILAVLQDNAALSVAEIGTRVGLSSTPCWKRIQRLEAAGVILKRVALVDQERVGLPISVFVSIETGDHSQDWLDRFAKTVTAMPEVMEFYRMAGDVDYMLRVAVADIAGYDSFYKRLIAAVPLKNVTFCHGKDQVDDRAADSGKQVAVHSIAWPAGKLSVGADQVGI